MADEGDEGAAADAAVEASVHLDGEALTLQLKGERFKGGRLPVSALATLERTNAMVLAIARDLEVSEREGATNASRYAGVELVLVGEIGHGSALLNALLVPLFLAAPGPALEAQTTRVHNLQEVVPAVVNAVHAGTEVPAAISAKTMRLVAEVGRDLGAEDELVLSPSNVPPEDVTSSMSASVTLASSTRSRLTQEVSETRSFFVTGTLRQLENHGDEPGKLTLATTSGLYAVPGVDVGIVERAARLLGDDRNAVLALSGQGTVDGRGRLKQLTHLTDMRRIDRLFNPEQRFSELAQVSEAPLAQARIDFARSVIERAVLASGRAPGLFLDENDQVEARWLIHRTPDAPATVVNVSFGRTIDIYVFDREAGEVTFEQELALEEVAPGDQIADLIAQTAAADA